MLKTSDFIYELPPELIAQDPLPDRSASRLLVMGRESGALEHKHFTDLPSYLRKGDCLVLNDSRVIPARLYGVREDTGGAVEVLLLKRMEEGCWECLVRPGKKARPGMRLTFGDGLLHAEVLDMMEEGNRRIRFSCEGIFEEILDRLGEMPLPPYITHKLPREQR
ncbi:MAG: S-adenosylmethionine:tRNA ribosyltransferase-isomerase, partial [Lachnospiraceae bacterium]|nr:S-adenosylmethionine:tRNA ribosyltransferase-isomerase [Lachnospiraceae bacterium]